MPWCFVNGEKISPKLAFKEYEIKLASFQMCFKIAQ